MEWIWIWGSFCIGWYSESELKLENTEVTNLALYMQTYIISTLHLHNTDGLVGIGLCVTSDSWTRWNDASNLYATSPTLFLIFLSTW